ncbi:MAG TPA: hypothetical protein VIJ76_02930 [Galbitalea sp.]
MSASLESRYRRALRWYPESWREQNGSAMLATLLDVASAQSRTRPSAGELFSLAANGLRARASLLELLVPAPVRDRAAAVSLGAGGAIAVAGTLMSVQSVHVMRAEGFAQGNPWGNPVITFGPFASLGIVLYGLWIIALIAATCGLAKTTRALLALTIPAAFVARLLSEQLHLTLFPTSTTVMFLELFAVIALVGRPTLTRKLRIATGLAAVGAAVAIAIELLSIYRSPSATNWFLFERSFFWDAPWAGWTFGVLLVAAILCLALRSRVWAGACLVLSLPFLGLILFGSKDLTYIAQLVEPLVGVLVIAGAAVLLFRGLGLRIRITRG